MLNLARSQSACDVLHQRFLDDALPKEVSRAAFEAFKPSAYDRESLELGRVAWEMRTLDEYRSQVAFTELLMELTEMGFAFDILGTAVRVVRDEARHVELCRRMVAVLGGSETIPGEPTWVRSDPTQPLMRRVVRTVIGSLCVGETFSVRMLAAVRDTTIDPLTRNVVTCLAADESIHSQFGWTVLEALAPHLSEEDRADIDATLPYFLGASEVMVVRSAPQAEESLATAPTNPFGFMNDKERARVFYDTLERDILRRLDALGIHGRKAWDARVHG